MNGLNFKNISVNNGVVTYDIPNNIATYSNGIMKISEANNSNIIFDIDTSSLQTKLSASNKLSSAFITGLTNLNLINGGSEHGANILYNNTIKNLSLVSGTTTLDLGAGTFIRSNNYLSLTESADNQNIIIDINNNYLHTRTSLTTLFYTQASTNSILTNSYYSQASTNSLLTSKQDFININSNLSLANFTCTTNMNIGNASGTTAILQVKGSSTKATIAITGGTTGANRTMLLMTSAGHNQITAQTRSGVTSVYNLGLIPMISQFTATNNPADLTPAVLKAIITQKAGNTDTATWHFGLNVNSVGSVLQGLVLYDGTQNVINIDGLLALIVANIQNIYTNLKAAGVAGFTTY